MSNYQIQEHEAGGFVVVDMDTREVVSEDFPFRFNAVQYMECLKALDTMQLELARA